MIKEMTVLLYCWYLCCGLMIAQAVDPLSFGISNISYRPYLIKQRYRENQPTEIYSPYVLWNNAVNPNPLNLTDPLKIFVANGYAAITFTVDVAYITTEVFAYHGRVFCYNSVCKAPAPTIFAKPGDVLDITLINNLEPTSSNSSIFIDEVFYPNRTNIFIQSIPIDPSINSIFRYTQGGGDSLSYRIKIPAETSPGIHWYHSRVHGTAALSVMGGLYGAIVIQPKDYNGFPSSYITLPRQLLVLSHMMLDRDISVNFSQIDDDFATSSLSYTYLSRAYGSTLSINASFANGGATNTTIYDAWLANGRYQPIYSLSPYEWVVFDILVASADRIVELEIRTDVGYGAGQAACEMHVMGINGQVLPMTRLTTHLPLMQSDRVSVAVKCVTAGRYYLQSVTALDGNDALEQIGDLQTKSNQVLLQLDVQGQRVYMDDPPVIQDFITTLGAPLSEVKGPLGVISIATAQRQLTPSSNETKSDFDVGVGQDCRLPCYDPILCTALYGQSNYSLDSFPTVVNGNCSFSSFNATTPSTNFSTAWTETFLGQNALNITFASLNFTVFGSVDFLYPIYIQNGALELQSFEQVNLDNSNILLRDDYSPGYDRFNYSLYGDYYDVNDVWPVVPGQISFKMTVKEGLSDGILLSTTFLKYEDRGFLRQISVTTSMMLGQSTGNGSSQSSLNNGIAINNSLSTPNIADILSPDSAPFSALCSPLGQSYRFNESFTADLSTRLIDTNSCPNHFCLCQSNECGGNKVRVLQFSQQISVPLYPVLAASREDLTCSQDLIGIAVNGVGIFSVADEAVDECLVGSYGNPLEVLDGQTTCFVSNGQRGRRYCGDILPKIGVKVDKCGGSEGFYRGQSIIGDLYRYHMLPVCLYQQLSLENPSQSRHSPQLGWAMDGFPIYGPVGVKGILMRRCGTSSAHPTICLDQCLGFYGKLPEVDEYLYRYYMVGAALNVGQDPEMTITCSTMVQNSGSCAREAGKCCVAAIPAQSLFPYVPGCLRGCRVGDLKCESTAIKGTTSKFIPQEARPPNGVYNDTAMMVLADGSDQEGLGLEQAGAMLPGGCPRAVDSLRS